jgi:GT2 family glycosyltransferase
LIEKKNIFFSVVIPTFERPDDLRRCLTSLEKDAQAPYPDYEIIVTDDSTSEKCRTVVENEFPKVSWGTGRQNGPAGNRNAGVNRATGEWIIFLDDDCIAQDGFLNAYADAIHSNPQVKVFEGRIFAERPRRSWEEGCPENEHGGMFWTSNLCVEKNLFELLDGFDETFEVAFEDVDFAYRFKKLGIPTKFVRNASASHPWRNLGKGDKNWKKKDYELDSLKIFVQKHGQNEYANTKSYLKNLVRMLTSDLYVSLFVFKTRGFSKHIHNVFSTILSILFLIKNRWN